MSARTQIHCLLSYGASAPAASPRQMAIAEGLRWVGDSKGLQEGEGPTEAKRVEVWSSDSPEGSNGGWCGSKLKKKESRGYW